MDSEQILAQKKIADAYDRLEQTHDTDERREIWREIESLVQPAPTTPTPARG